MIQYIHNILVGRFSDACLVIVSHYGPYDKYIYIIYIIYILYIIYIIYILFMLCCAVLWGVGVEGGGNPLPPLYGCGVGVSVLCCAVLCCAVLCSAVLCCSVLCCAVLCCAQCALLCMSACARGHITCFSLFFLAFPCL